ncbi:fibronectin type III domain protein [Chitinophaga dinghuensis]|uniref:Fibronectin type III domain protein n=1 Tax=Chitinophaga dinghuensis TaxID=1539050 RepID=A0A327WKG9_9BACT|nr:fibronectin type III domain-containing protein [Chitinophaga dinghuensis]RAJ88284.1 fibronectin type III domain protein [Chitinophaga dinghuensis]
MNVCKRFIYTLFLLLTGMQVMAQTNHPVMVNVQLNPPYSLYLSDYAAPDVQRMQVHILLKDLTETNYKCRLRLKIEGPGITLQSRTGFYVSPILINGGEMLTLSGPDLAPYFNPQNLFIQGLDNNAFTKNGAKLPEGIYKFTIEVLDYLRNTTVSNQGTAMVAGFLSYPPIINLPMANTKVDAMDPQNVVFQWMPRHTASINAAFNVVYKFRLVELIPENRDPNDAMRSLRPIYENMTEQTMMVYGPGEPALTPGNNYAVQVQAVEADGKDMFVNDGFSEVVKFTYGEKCSVPQQIVAAFAGKNDLKLTWNATTSQQGFTVRYRESGDTPSQWYEDNTYLPQAVISGLKPGKKYEYQVKGQCIWGYGDYSAVQDFTMPNETMTKGDFVCGRDPNLSRIENTKGLEKLKAQDTIYAGDFKVIILQATGSNGNFSGEGQVMVPLLNFADLGVTFNNISVNTDKRMYAGVIELAQDNREQVSKDLSQALKDYINKLDGLLSEGTTPKDLMTIDALQEMSIIDKLKGWDELDAKTKEALDEIQDKLKDLKAYQDQYPDMTPEQRETSGQQIAKDLNKAKNALADAAKAIGEALKELFNLFRRAQKKVRESYTESELAKLKSTLDINEASLDRVISRQRSNYASTATTDNTQEVILLGKVTITETIPDAGMQANIAYVDAMASYYKQLVILTLAKENLSETQLKTITNNLKVEGYKTVSEMETVATNKDDAAKDKLVDSLSKALVELGNKLFELKISNGKQ